MEARRRDDRLVLAVHDDGTGFTADAASGPGEGHFGLSLIRERARSPGAAVSIDSAPGRGTRIALDLPLAADVGLGQ